jgi:hypothetical protein
MFKIFFLILSCGLLYNLAFSQNVESLKISNNDIEGVDISRSSIFNENSLWGYINGGADLYLEYGFVEVLVQELRWENESFKVEAYLMSNPDAAYGIFSVSKYSCHSVGRVAKWDCINPYQVQATLGNLYLSVIAFNGNQKSMELAIQIANIIASKLQYTPFGFPNFIPTNNSNVLESGIKLISGELALQNAYASIEDVFSGLANYKIYVLPMEFNSIDLIITTFKNDIDMRIALTRFKQKQGFVVLQMLNIPQTGFMIINTKGKYLPDKDIKDLEAKFTE